MADGAGDAASLSAVPSASPGCAPRCDTDTRDGERTPRAEAATTEFLEANRIALIARAQRLSRLPPRRVGLRPQDMPFAPSAEHFLVANRRLGQISGRIARRLDHLNRVWSKRTTEPKL